MRLPTASSATVWRNIGGILRRFRGKFALVILLQLSVALAAIVTPQLIGRAIDAVSEGTTTDYLRKVIISVFIVVILQGVLAFFGEREAMKLGERVFMVLRNRVVYAVTHLPLSIVESAGTGDLLGRTTHDIDRVAVFIQRGISRFIVLVLTIVVTMVAAFVADPRVGFVVLVPLIPMTIVIRWYLKRTIPAYLAASALWAGTSGVVSEAIEQGGTVDSINLGRNRVSRLDTLIREFWRNERYTAWMRGMFMACMMTTVLTPIIIAVLWGAFLIGKGLTTIGAVTTVALYAQQLRSPLNEIGWWIDEAQFAMVSFARIFGVEEVKDDDSAGEEDGTSAKNEDSPHDNEATSSSSQIPHSDELVIRDVSFAYTGGDNVLHDVTLNVRTGETLAIVGPSGAGKSTLGRLIAGINAPTSGSITIGGAEVTHISEKERHSIVALVTQEHHVFVGTIADNLRLAKPEATEQELHLALDAVEAGEWIDSLEDGLETRVGSGGLKVTPGQAQQIALARIVLLDPDILVLDEATSLLDPTAARSLERALANVLAGRTVMSIAHRLYTAHDADRVAVMIDGRLAELGSHDELVAAKGEYARLWNTWQQD
ncbi:ABC transporter ATP-binding protein [Arcanobacterium haemolyticum]|nr:ABC transporter ATP-binding protein [Arcanobacterium haemolyticum]